jgi:hypothetical protein
MAITMWFEAFDPALPAITRLTRVDASDILLPIGRSGNYFQDDQGGE